MKMNDKEYNYHINGKNQNSCNNKSELGEEI